MSRFTKVSLSKVLRNLYKSQDYRGDVVTIIQEEFLSFAIDFFKQVVIAKIENQNIDIDWYKKRFLENKNLKKEEIAINSGLNMKTISNKYKSTTKEIVLIASKNQYEELTQSIEELLDLDPEININLTITYNKASVSLTLSETLIVVNTLAVKRAAIRGGAWSSIGKNIEKPLMKSLCLLYGVPKEYYSIIYKKADYAENDTIYSREIDFYLTNKNNEKLLCEVKLMGKGNPESADAVIARNTSIFIADTLSETNKRQLNDLEIEWLEFRSDVGFRKFKDILEKKDIPYNKNVLLSDELIEYVITDDSIY